MRLSASQRKTGRSSADQSEDLERQTQRFPHYAAYHGAHLYGMPAARKNRVEKAKQVLL